MLGFLLCTPIFILALLSVNSAMENKLVEKDEVPVKQTWSCPPGWSNYQSATRVYCILMSKENNNYTAAKAKCHNLGGFLATLEDEDKKRFVIEFARKTSLGNSVRIGLYKEAGSNAVFKWQGRNSVNATDMHKLKNHHSSLSYELCGFISGSTYNLELTSCQGSIHAICEREVSCSPGYYGHKCERECHCLRELCQQEPGVGPESLVCKYGCQISWTGAACDIEIKGPEVKYYCINSGEDNNKLVYIRIYTKGLQYREIYGMTSNKVRGEWCNSTIIQTHSSNLTTIRIPVDNISIDQMSSGECAGQKVGPDTFSWSIVLNEHEGYLQEPDAKFKITCDFSVADSLVRSGEFSLEREEHLFQENVIGPEPLQDDVLLQLINGSTEQLTTKAVIGTPVILEMKYALQKGSQVLGVRPHNCLVYTQDEKHLQQLLDKDGCQVPNSIVKPFRIEEGNKIRTPWFKLFTFENETSVTFHCAFDLCFTSDCKVGCQKKSRKRRDTADLTDQVAHFTTRTIRVLSSIPDKGDGQAED